MLTKLIKIFYFAAYSVVITATIASGLYFAILKNKHTLVQREINTIEQRTRSHKNLLTQYQADLQNSSNRFLLKEQIKASSTELEPIKKIDIITIPPVTNPRIVQTEQ